MRPELAFGAVGAAVLLGLALAQASTLLPSCGLRLGALGDLVFCRSPAAGDASRELTAELERRATLEDRLRGLERRLAGLPACPPPQPVAEPEGLDAKRWREKDVSLLEGCWSLASDYSLRHVRTGVRTRVASWEMCFDSNGHGEQRLVLSDGVECTEGVAAAFREDGTLQIEDKTRVQCSDRSYIYRRIMRCTLEPNGQAACVSRQRETGSTSNVRIMRRESR